MISNPMIYIDSRFIALTTPLAWPHKSAEKIAERIMANLYVRKYISSAFCSDQLFHSENRVRYF